MSEQNLWREDVDVNEMSRWNIKRVQYLTDNRWLSMWSIRFIFLFILVTKMWTENKTVPSTWYIFNVQWCLHWFSHVPWIVIGLDEVPANFYREKRSVAFVTGHLFNFLVVLSLICLVITQILICEKQTIWWLEILLRTIVAALLKTKGNGYFV